VKAERRERVFVHQVLDRFCREHGSSIVAGCGNVNSAGKTLISKRNAR
jgi:hypothetical protein